MPSSLMTERRTCDAEILARASATGTECGRLLSGGGLALSLNLVDQKVAMNRWLWGLLWDSVVLLGARS
jgi:hypothetical protein